jgi:hypothetical protein
LPDVLRTARAGLLAALAAAPLPAAEPAPLPRHAAAAPAAEAVGPAEAAALFAMPAVTEAARAAFARRAAGDAAGAAAALDALIARHPGVGALRAGRAVLAMLDGDLAAALGLLEAAAAAGTDVAALAADPAFAPLAADPALATRLEALATAPPAPPRAPSPAPVAGGAALVAAANTAWNPETERLEPRFTFSPAPDAAVLPPQPKTAARELLREHADRGRAAGNHGDLYDNRDRGHSRLPPAAFPQLAHITYAPAARDADLDYGLNDRLLFGRPTFGNSSTAVTGGALWRSLPRLALTRADGTGPLRLWQNASTNHLYVHPAHKDFDDKNGDLFPANTPYLLVSRGSSRSDQPFLEALAMILAAFRPDTKARLTEENLVVPTVQMVFRRSLQNVRSRADYFSGAAHPAAFEGFRINLARMVSLANSIAPDAIPAEVRIRVLEEDLGTEGVDFFGQGLTEQLFDTPGAVARIWRSKAGRRTMLVSAEASRDPNGRPLGFEWHLLQGDPEKVRIEPLAGGARARITIDWHDPFPISEEVPLETSRVDIGVFAHNGVHDSAPAILSWYFPPVEKRRYAPGPDGAPRIVTIDHADPERAKAYADPMLVARADWRDAYAYDAAGKLLGWTRHRAGGSEDFTPDGRRVLTRDAAGRPQRTEAVAHVLDRDRRGRLVVEELSAAAHAAPADAQRP